MEDSRYTRLNSRDVLLGARLGSFYHGYFFIEREVSAGRGEEPGGGGALGYFLRGYVPPGTPNWHPVLKKNFP